jgi:flagellar FliL protein
MSAAAAAAPNEAAPKKGKKGLIIIIAVLVLVLAGGGVGAFIYMKKSAAADEHGDKKGAKKKAEKKHGPPQFAPLDPFTVNLADPGREHYLQIGLTYEVAAADVAEALKAQMPLIRSRVLLLLTSRTADELASPAGKAKLATELVALARAALANSEVPGAQNDENGINDVHFSSFIIQ